MVSLNDTQGGLDFIAAESKLARDRAGVDVLLHREGERPP